MAAYDKNVDYSDLIAAEAAKGVNADRQLLAELRPRATPRYRARTSITPRPTSTPRSSAAPRTTTPPRTRAAT